MWGVKLGDYNYSESIASVCFAHKTFLGTKMDPCEKWWLITKPSFFCVCFWPNECFSCKTNACNGFRIIKKFQTLKLVGRVSVMPAANNCSQTYISLLYYWINCYCPVRVHEYTFAHNVTEKRKKAPPIEKPLTACSYSAAPASSVSSANAKVWQHGCCLARVKARMQDTSHVANA